MNYTLQTAQAKAIISSRGGELLSLQSSDGLEYVKRYDWKYSVEILSGIYKELCQ